MKHYILFIVLGLAMTSCGPEINPFSCAPPCPVYEWCPPENPSGCLRPILDLACTCMPDCEKLVNLCDMIDMALHNSPLTQETWAQAREAAADYGISRAEFYPDIAAQGYFEHYRNSTFFGTNDLVTETLSNYGPVLTVNWILFNFGTTAARAASMREALLKANLDHNREVQTVIQTIMIDYYTYILNRELVEAARADLTDAEVSLEATTQKYYAGVSDLSDQLQAETVVAQRALQLLDEEQKLANSLAQLTQDLGIPSTTVFEIQSLPKEIPTDSITASVCDLVADAYKTRPDLYASIANVRSAEAALSAAKRSELPVVTFTGDASRDYFNQGIVSGVDYTAEVKVEFPIFKGFYYKNTIRKAKARVELARAQMRELMLQISSEVVQEYRDFLISGKKVPIGEEYVSAAAESFKASLEKYKAGTTDFTTLASALSNLADARAALITARQDWYTSLTDLAYAMGSLNTGTCCRE